MESRLTQMLQINAVSTVLWKHTVISEYLGVTWLYFVSLLPRCHPLWDNLGLKQLRNVENDVVTAVLLLLPSFPQPIYSVCSVRLGGAALCLASAAADNIQPWNVTSEPQMTLTLERQRKHPGSQQHACWESRITPATAATAVKCKRNSHIAFKMKTLSPSIEIIGYSLSCL